MSARIPVNTQHSKIFFCAGDVSGDIHSAEVAQRVLELHPGWKIDAVCGPHLREAGARQIGDSSGCGVIGFASAMALLPKVLLLQRRVLHYFKTEKPDAVLLCDWGAFNGRLLPHLKKLDIPVLYYFPPRSWQKTGDGGLAIAPLVDAAATPFEWSAQRLRKAGCRAEWVGHPLLERVRELRQSAAKRDENQIALLPGSRALEWKWIAPHMAEAARLILKQKPQTKFVVVVPRGVTTQVQKYFSGIAQITEGNATKVLLESRAAIVKSGTATLEAAVCDTPQVVVYEVPPLLHLQARVTGLAKKIPFAAMPNIIAGREIIPELLGGKCRGPLIAEKVLLLLDDENYRIKMQQDYAGVRRALGEKLPFTATERTAEMLEEMLACDV